MFRDFLRFSVLVFVWLAFAFGGTTVTAQEAGISATIDGRVEDAKGGGIADARITLRDSGGMERGNVVTDPEGRFSFAGVSPGKYTLHAESKSFESSTMVIEVVGGTSPPPLTIAMKVAPVTQTVTVQAPGEYVQSLTVTASKLDTPVYQTPLTVNTVARGLIDDQGSRNLEQILQNVPAVQSNDAVGGWGFKTFQVRGFDLDNTLFEDGVRLPQYADVDPAIIDHVDVLKGSAGSMYGRIEPGGIINIVTLKPQPVRAYSFAQTFGPYGDVRTEFDATGSLNRSNSLLYRGIVAYERANSYRDVVQTRHLTVAPSLQWNPGSRDRVEFRFEYKDWQGTGDDGFALIPVGTDPNTGNFVNRLPNLPRNVYFGPSGNFVFPKTTQETIAWTHTFTPNWQVKSTFVHYHLDQPGVEGGPSGWSDPYPTGLDGYGTTTPTTATYYVGNPSNVGAHGSFVEVDINGKFSTFGIEHNFLASGEYLTDRSFYECWCYGGGSLDVTNPVYQPVSAFPPPPGSYPAFGYSSGNRWAAGTIQDQVTIRRRLHLLAGVRYDAATGLSGSAPAAAIQTPDRKLGDSKASPRVGASYDLTSWLAGFASYSESFGGNPNSVLFNGKISTAETSRQVEGGIKGHWLDNRLVGEISYFDLRKRNVVVGEPLSSFNGSCTAPSPNNPNACLIQVGEIGSKGFEFQLTGRINRSWGVNLNYANLSAAILDVGDPTDTADNPPVGQRLASIPRNAGSAWLNYEHKSGWRAGFGAVATGSRPFDQPFSQAAATLTLPRTLLLNAVVGYEWKMDRTLVTATVRFSNLSNTNVWQSGWGYTGAIPGEPRTAYGTIKFAFH